MTNRTNCRARSTYGMIINRRKKVDTVLIQGMKKDGTWGKPIAYERLSKSETDEMVVQRLIKNNNQQFRLAE